MNRIAEYGIAAHAFYKEGAGSPNERFKRESNAFAWLRHTQIDSRKGGPRIIVGRATLLLVMGQCVGATA